LTGRIIDKEILMPGIRYEAATEIPTDVDVIGIPVYADLSSPEGAGGPIDAAFLTRFGFEGKPGQSQVVPSGNGASHIAVGVGEVGKVDTDVIRKAAAALSRAAGHATSIATTLPTAAPTGVAAGAATVEGIGLAAYRFAGDRRKPPVVYLESVTVVGAAPEEVTAGQVAVEATNRTRDWVNLPARQLTPTRLGELATELAAAHGLAVDVWDAGRIDAERLGALAGVAAGSDEPARLIRLAYEPEGAAATVALVGKGITFDSGGLSLKSTASMMTMKDDMGGAAAVISAVVGAAALGLGVRVVGWVATTENMPSGTAIHPGDVLIARNGTSIEVLNTDAEGRLVLADALSLAAEEKPDAIVDVATLTGAQIVALGERVAAVFSNDDALAERVIAAGARAGEPAWRLPLVAAYRPKIDSEVADLKNVASGGGAGSIIAALFLQEFVDDIPWAHLDIAGPSWTDSEDGWLVKGGTGWAARTLIELLAGWGD
jgi:leucyl aminopeptidase